MAASESPFKHLLPYLLLSAAVLFSFGRSVRAPFHFDDHALLVDPAITSPAGGVEVWRLGQTRPLTYFTFWVNHRLGGADPSGYHAVNLAIHITSAFLVMLCLRRLLPGRAALIAAFVFAVHPAQTEAVIYVFARSTLLSSCLTFAALLVWLKGRHWLAVAWFAAALLAKEEVAAFPVFVGMLHLTISRNRQERGPIVAMLVLACAAVARVAVVAATTPGSGAGSQAGVSPLDYFLTQGYVILRYLQLLVIPIGFTVDPEIELLRDWRGVLCWATVACLAALGLRSIGRARAGFWLLAALILIAPTSSVFPAADLAADRRLYLPMFAFSAIAGLLLERTTYPMLLTAGATVLAMLSFARGDVWMSEVRLWEDAMQWAPNKARPRVQLARVSPPNQALNYLLEAKNIAPDDPLVASELGRLFLERRQPSEALAEFGRAVALRPGDAVALNNRGVALMMLGIKEHAVTDFEQALTINPCLADARKNLGIAGVSTVTPDECKGR